MPVNAANNAMPCGLQAKGRATNDGITNSAVINKLPTTFIATVITKANNNSNNTRKRKTGKPSTAVIISLSDYGSDESGR